MKNWRQVWFQAAVLVLLGIIGINLTVIAWQRGASRPADQAAATSPVLDHSTHGSAESAPQRSGMMGGGMMRGGMMSGGMGQMGGAMMGEHDDGAEQQANFAKLSDEDRPLAEAQGYCVVTTEPLGSMGPPIKLVVNEQPVFICCKSCEKKALSNPEKTLAKLEELKAQVRRERSEKKEHAEHGQHGGKNESANAHDHADAGHEHGPGKGMRPGMGGPGMMRMRQDMLALHALLDQRDLVERSITDLPNGVETLTESDDEKVAKMIREHVAAMHKRLEKNEPMPMMTQDKLFVEIFKHAKQIKIRLEETPKGLKVIQTSDDPYVARLVQAHARLVDAFIANGMEEIHREHAVPSRDPTAETTK